MNVHLNLESVTHLSLWMTKVTKGNIILFLFVDFQMTIDDLKTCLLLQLYSDRCAKQFIIIDFARFSVNFCIELYTTYLKPKIQLQFAHSTYV